MGRSGAQVIPRDVTDSGQLNDPIEKDDFVSFVRIVNDPFIDIVRGVDTGKDSIHRFGNNPDVPNGVFERIWSQSGAFVFPTTTEAFRVRAGGNVNDTSAGTGARTVQIVYLDGSGNLQQEQLTLAGASASASTTGSGRRIIRAWVDSVGVIEGSNIGDIIIENETSAQEVGFIATDFGQTQTSMYTVPVGFTAFLTRIELNIAVGTNRDADVRFWQRNNAYVTTAPFGARRIVRQWLAVQGNIIAEYDSPFEFEELTDIWFEAKGNGAGTSIEVDYDLILTEN
jgi:hypothetical protein